LNRKVKYLPIFYIGGIIIPNEYRDPYSQAKLFIPTQEEKNMKALELELRDKIKKVDDTQRKLSDSQKKLDEYLQKIEGIR